MRHRRKTYKYIGQSFPKKKLYLYASNLQMRKQDNIPCFDKSIIALCIVCMRVFALAIEKRIEKKNLGG